MNVIKRIINSIHLFTVSFAKLLLALMVILISVQVFCRYVLDFSIRWSEEIALLMVVWFCFISLAIGVKRKLHISIEVFTEYLPEGIKKIIFKINDLAILALGIVLLKYGWELVQKTSGSTLPATGWSTAVLYIVIPISGLLVIYDSVTDLFGIDKLDDEIKERLMEGGGNNA